MPKNNLHQTSPITPASEQASMWCLQCWLAGGHAFLFLDFVLVLPSPHPLLLKKAFMTLFLHRRSFIYLRLTSLTEKIENAFENEGSRPQASLARRHLELLTTDPHQIKPLLSTYNNTHRYHGRRDTKANRTKTSDSKTSGDSCSL